MTWKEKWLGLQIKLALVWEFIKELVKAPFTSSEPTVEMPNRIPKWEQPLSNDEVLQLYAENEKEISKIWEELAELDERTTMRTAVQEWLRRKPRFDEPIWDERNQDWD